MLYNKHNYLNKNIDYIISKEIIEYDIKSAGFNIIKRYRLLPEEDINNLELLDKKERQIQIGKFQKKYKGLTDELNSKFIEIRKEFFESNNLSDDDILSIKKDAIITFKRCHNLIYDNIEFVDKHVYSSYYYMNDLEIYIDKWITIKGLSDDVLEPHKNYMLDILFKILKGNEISSRKKNIKNLVKFATYYKNKDLEIGYYRELNNDSLYKTNFNLINGSMGLADVDSLEGIDISYNYLHYIIPMIGILI